MLARSKCSSVVRKFVIYGPKKFYNIGPKSDTTKMLIMNLLITALLITITTILLIHLFKWQVLYCYSVAPGACIIKLITAVIYSFRNKLD
jgi:hypothetical protein